MIRVCDAIMGSGKTSAAINYMNERTEKRFIYITPYLEEASRIKDACPKRKFAEPKKGIEEYGFTKVGHSRHLIEQGRNIATTHQAFAYYTQDVLDLIKEKQYTLIIDESISALNASDTDKCDLDVLINSGYLKETEDGYTLGDKPYTGKKFKEEFRYLMSRNLIKNMGDDTIGGAFYWQLPADLINAFDDVFVLTYLFEAQEMCYFMLLHGLKYEKIGVSVDEDGCHRFCEDRSYMPEYTKTLGSHIHICEHKKLNSIGDSKYALSKSWLSKVENTEKLKKNIHNYFQNIQTGSSVEDRMWATYDDAKGSLKGGGYATKYTKFNERATNKYRDRTVLVYAVNVFPNTGKRLYLHQNGVRVDDDLYALSFLVQWIWRSAIRDGKDIWIYIPSKRMRDILIDWIDKVERGVPIC